MRDRFTRNSELREDNPYISRMLSLLDHGKRLCDIGCGTGHIVAYAAKLRRRSLMIGLDISHAVIERAAANTKALDNVALILGDGMRLPFKDKSLDIVTDRLAEYSHHEARRVLRDGGHLLEYGLGPEANKEIRQVFKDRIEASSFSVPKNLERWKAEVRDRIERAGFAVSRVVDHKVKQYYRTENDLIDLIEMVPLVRRFDGRRNWALVRELASQCRTGDRIAITWHYYIAEARRP